MPPQPEPSSQESPPSKRSGSRILFIILSVIATLGICTFFAYSFALNAFLHSEAFRVFINQKTSAVFHADGQYMPLHWSGMSFYSDGYEARGQAQSPFTSLRADQIRAEFYPRGIFHHAWQIDDLQIQRLRIGFGKLPLAASSLEPAAALPKQPAGNSWIPTKVDIRRTQIHQTELDWSLMAGDGNIRQAEVILEPDGSAFVATVTGGRLFQTGWPMLEIDHVKMRYREPELFITDGLFKTGDAQSLGLSGQVSLEGDRLLDLRVKLNGISISPFVPDDWRARLKGNAVGEVTLKGPLQDASRINASGTINLTGAQLEALPVLDKIAAFTRTEQFRKIALQKASGDFLWADGKLRVNRVLLESEGLIRIEGDFTVQNGNMDGVFQVGVTPASLRWLPGSQTRVFTSERAGFVWTSVRVTGPVANLNEDLSARLVAAAQGQIIDDVRGAVEKHAKDVLDLLSPLVR